MPSLSVSARPLRDYGASSGASVGELGANVVVLFECFPLVIRKMLATAAPTNALIGFSTSVTIKMGGGTTGRAALRKTVVANST